MGEAEPGGGSPRDRMRAGVGEWIVRTALATGQEMRRWSPETILAMFCAGALAPLVFAGSVAELAGSLGGNVLAGVIDSGVRQLRGRVRNAPVSQDAVTRELAAHLLKVLEADQAQATRLRQDIAEVLRRIEAADAVFRAAVETRDCDVLDTVRAAFEHLGGEIGEFAFLLTDLRESSATILQALYEQNREHRALRAATSDILTQVALLHDDLVILGQERQAVTEPSRDATALPGWRGGSPYRGLWPYDGSHAQMFYGREEQTARLLVRLAERASSPVGVLMVTGASGVGKSSLIQAGLMPAVARGGLQIPGSQAWPWIVVTPTGDPLGELAARLAARFGGQATALRRELTADPAQAHLIIWQAALAAVHHASPVGADSPAAEAARLILVADQFEELFSPSISESSRQAYLDALEAIATNLCGASRQPPGLLVIGIRSDYLDYCAAVPYLAAVLDDRAFVLGPMSEPELARAIEGPARRAGAELEPGMADIILRDLRSGHENGRYSTAALPLLSQAMLATWNNRDGNRLTIRGYGETGGVHGAIQASANRVFDGLILQPDFVTCGERGPDARRPPFDDHRLRVV